MTFLVDAEAREFAVHRTDLNVMVDAGAGSGKTKILVDRVCQLVDEGVAIRNSAAVTFSEAAASELRDRLRAELSDTHPDEVADLDAAAIGTLHSFARRILAEHPVEAGLPPVVEVLDEVASSVRMSRWWSTVRAQLLTDDALAEPLRVLLDAGIRVSSWSGGRGGASMEALALRLQSHWDLVEDHLSHVEPPPIPGPDFGVVEAVMDELLDLLGECADAEDKLFVRVEQVLAWCRELLEAGSTREVLEIMRAAPSFRAGNIGRKGIWTDIKAVRECLLQLEGVNPLVPVYQASLQHLLVFLGREILAAADQRRREGLLLFHDLLVFARQVLRTNEQVRVELQQQYKHLLLDEFQDTDPIQVELAVRIAAGADGGAEDWRDCPAPQGSIFVVGDPKQSIYRFRRADIATFMEFAAFLGDEARAELTTNFRSHSDVLEWINTVFGELIVEAAAVQPPYIALDPSPERSHPDDQPRVIMALPDGEEESEAKDVEAQRIVDVIATALAERWPMKGRSIRPSDITVLVPARSQLDALESALAGANVPYRLMARSLIYGTDVIRDLLLVASAADDPTNELVLAEALRTPVLRCGDDDLWRWKAAGGSWRVWAEPPAGLPSDEPVGPAMAYLDRLHKALRSLSPSEVLTHIVESHDLLALAAGYPDPAEIWRRYRIVIDQARQWSETAHGSLREYLQWARARADGEDQQNETVLPEHDADNVSVMTIHAAKGLQFGMVVVSGLIEAPRATPGSVVWTEHGPESALGNKDAGVFSAGWVAARDAEAERLAQEDQRLLYVACTRAQEYLVVSGFGKKEKSRGLALRKAAAGHLVWSERGTVLPARGRSAAPSVAEGWLARREAQVASASLRQSVSAGDIAHGQVPMPTGLKLELLPGLDKNARDLERPSWEKGRYGTAVGRAVHATLQTVDLATGDGLDGAARAQALAEGVVEQEDVVVALARSGFAAAVTREAAACPHQKETYVGTVAGDQVVEGVIDLLFTDADGQLVVVDYKTDAEPDQATLEAYQKQLAVYASALRDATGLQVGRRVLVFCREGGAQEVEV